MLSREELLSIQADAMADDVEIDLEKMTSWSEAEARAYFESGGTLEPRSAGSGANFTRGDAPTAATPWMRCLAKKPEAAYRVVVFSWTGNRGGQGSAHNLMRPNWSVSMAQAEVFEVLLPGRGMRQKEQLYTDVKQIVSALACALGPALKGGSPYAFVGFSFGAILAYETAIRISASYPGEGPALVCAVSAEGPAWPHRKGIQHQLDDSAFKSMLAEKKGTDFILRDVSLTRLYLPVIKADLALEETYDPPTGPPRLNIPVMAFFGEAHGRDHLATRVARDAAELWLEATSDATASRVVALPEVDWYVFQEPSGTAAVQEAVANFMAML